MSAGARRHAALIAAGLVVVALAVVAARRLSPTTTRGEALSAEQLRLAERIYREGILPSGALLRARRADGGELTGAQAACVQCHRRSGMGTVEGNRIVPPITGQFLFQPRANALGELDGRHTRGPDLDHALGRNRSRAPYGDRTLARAIRDGIDSSDWRLDVLMPRYELDEADARLLIAYLRQLSDRWPRGVSAETIHFATVVAPGVAPARRKAVLDVLQAFFSVRNTATRLQRLREQSYAGAAHRTYRSWELHVWELSGAPETWSEQLVAHARREPVFALLSGVSEGEWTPVQTFCETQQIPCWFPTVDLPPSETGFYSLYFGKGVRLEAELLAHRLGERRDTPGGVIAIRGEDARAAGATRVLASALEASGLRVEERVLTTVDAEALRRASADATRADAIVYWLRGADLAQLDGVPPPPAATYFSTIMSGGEHAPLPPSWKAQAKLVYPFELPDRRRAALSRFHAWLKSHRLELVDERLQADAWLASWLISEKIDEMLENPSGEYLIERAEAIVSMRLPTAMYHRLSLAPAQRFASKGGYLARFASSDGNGDALAADSDWIVPYSAPHSD